MSVIGIDGNRSLECKRTSRTEGIRGIINLVPTTEVCRVHSTILRDREKVVRYGPFLRSVHNIPSLIIPQSEGVSFVLCVLKFHSISDICYVLGIQIHISLYRVLRSVRNLFLIENSPQTDPLSVIICTRVCGRLLASNILTFSIIVRQCTSRLMPRSDRRLI